MIVRIFIRVTRALITLNAPRGRTAQHRTAPRFVRVPPPLPASRPLSVMAAVSAASPAALAARARVVVTAVRGKTRGGVARLSSSSSQPSRRSRASRVVVRAGATPADQSNIVVIGGTGGTGSECVVQALKRGAKVTVLARDPSKMRQPPGSGGASEGQPVSHPNLTVVQGSVTSAADVAKCITSDTTGVVVSLGGKTKDVGKTMLTDGTLNVINAMKAVGVKRVAVVTSIGAGDSADQAPFVFKILMATVMRSIFDDKNNQEQLFLGPAGPGRDLDFCIVRPGGEEKRDAFRNVQTKTSRPCSYNAHSPALVVVRPFVTRSYTP